jgi:HSP20 family molecular chaperone IbpA
VDEKKIEAHYMNGVLELRMKKTEQAMPKAIEVKVD